MALLCLCVDKDKLIFTKSLQFQAKSFLEIYSVVGRVDSVLIEKKEPLDRADSLKRGRSNNKAVDIDLLAF